MTTDCHETRLADIERRRKAFYEAMACLRRASYLLGCQRIAPATIEAIRSAIRTGEAEGALPAQQERLPRPMSVLGEGRWTLGEQWLGLDG